MMHIYNLLLQKRLDSYDSHKKIRFYDFQKIKIYINMQVKSLRTSIGLG